MESVRPNKVVEKIKSGATALNGWMSLGSASIAEIMAHAPWDSLTIDMQHGFASSDTTLNMLRAISTTEVTPMVRVPWLDPAVIMRVLDAGAYGIICPMVSTAGQARELVNAARYSPLGARSFGVTRANLYAGAEYWRVANERVLVFAMIETRQAVDNLEEILAVDGLSGVYIGPSDLSLSFGFDPLKDLAHPEVLAIIDMIKGAADKAGRFTAMHCTQLDYARLMMPRRFALMTVSNDSRMLAMSQDRILREVRGKG